MSEIEDLEKKTYWEQYSARRSQQIKQKSVMFEPQRSETKSVIEKMMQQTTELKRLLKQSNSENERLKQQIKQLEQTNALLSSQAEISKHTQSGVKPTKPVRQSQLTISTLGSSPSTEPLNKYAAHFQRRREEEYLADQLQRSKMIENELHKGQLIHQAENEARESAMKNKYNEEDLPEREQMRNVIRAQARRINELEEYVQELKQVPAYKRTLVRPPERKQQNLPQRVRDLQTKLIELKYRGAQAAIEADNGDGAIGMGAITAFQNQLQSHVAELREIGKELSDRAWELQRKIDAARPHIK